MSDRCNRPSSTRFFFLCLALVSAIPTIRAVQQTYTTTTTTTTTNNNNDSNDNPFLRDSSVARLVVQHLVDRIEDAELSIRVRASSLFATLSPALVLPPLCRRMVSPR